MIKNRIKFIKEREGDAMVEGKLKENVLEREKADVELMWRGKTSYHTLHPKEDDIPL